MSAEMPGLGNQRYLLDRVADLDEEPSVVLVRHVGADDTVHNSPIGICPGDAAQANIRSEFDETFASKSVEVKPQALLQTDSHSRSRHPISVPFVSENRCWNYYAAVGGVSGRVSPGGMGRVSTRHAGSRIGGNTQTQTRTEIIDSG